jgi:hypothetical protein
VLLCSGRLTAQPNVLRTPSARRGKKMKIDQNPFSIYDFLGYLIPGLFFTYATIFVVKYDFNNPFHLPLMDIKMDQYFIIIILSYIVGHILSFLSSVTVEVFAIWTLGYPSRYLLDLAFPGFWHNITNGKNMFNTILKLLMIVMIFPVIITDIIVRKIFRTKKLLGKSADKFTISLIQEKIPQYLEEHFKIDKKTYYPLNKEDNDFFNIIYHYCLEECTTHVSKMQNYVALYGFTRTLCFSLIALIWIIIIKGFGGTPSLTVFIVITFGTIISGILYLDFNKFFRKFSLEAFMAFLSKSTINKS